MKTNVYMGFLALYPRTPIKRVQKVIIGNEKILIQYILRFICSAYFFYFQIIFFLEEDRGTGVQVNGGLQIEKLDGGIFRGTFRGYK